MSLVQNGDQRALLDHFERHGAGHRPSPVTIQAALRSRAALEARVAPKPPQTTAEAASVALRGSWTGLETLAVVVPWALTLLTLALVFAGSGLLWIVLAAQLIGATVSTAAVLVYRYRTKMRR